MQSSEAKDKVIRPYRKVRTGVVTSDKMDKTVVVSVSRRAMHRHFHKARLIQKTIMAHDEKNECRIGDRVRIVETRPLSKRKCWRVQKILEQTLGEDLVKDVPESEASLEQ